MSSTAQELDVTYQIGDGGTLEWAGDNAFIDYESISMPDVSVAAQQEGLMAECGESPYSSDGTQSSAAEVLSDDVGALKTTRLINRLDTLRKPKIRFAAYAFALAVASPTVGEACTADDYDGPGSGPALDPVREWLGENTVRRSDDGGNGGGRSLSYCERLYEEAYPGGLPNLEKQQQYNREC